jgi:3-phosphoshikimate 1-carboxyvinyltransferase
LHKLVSMELTFRAPSGLGGEFAPPADKSLTHRAFMLAAVAEGSSRIANSLDTGDCVSTRRCLRELGAGIEEKGGEAVVRGLGLRGFREPRSVLDAENSGTCIRLLAGMLAGQSMFVVVTGDASITRRPMARVVEPLRRMGARVEGREGGSYAPLCFLPGKGSLSAMRYELPVASAQVKSALLFAALRAEGETRIAEAAGRSRDHTERLLRGLGIALETVDGELRLNPADSVPAFSFDVPGDVSSAAFFLAAAAVSGRQLLVRRCGLNPTRLGFLQVLRRMGISMETVAQSESLGEPMGLIRVLPGTLSGARIDPSEVPDLIDEIPLVAVLGLFARGRTEVRGAAELRHKESDRLTMIGRLAECLGGRIELFEDGFAVDGPQALRAGAVDPAKDHRIAMAAAVAGAAIPGGVKVSGFEIARVSYPDFERDFRSLGGVVE